MTQLGEWVASYGSSDDLAHLSANGVKRRLMQRVASERVQFGRVDLRSEPANGHRVVGVESALLEVAAVAGESVRGVRAADRCRTCNDRDDQKCEAQ